MLSQLPLLCRLTFQHSIACYVLVWNAIRFCECEKGNKIYQFPYFFFSCLRVKCLPRTRYVACTYKDTVCFYGQRINLIHKQTQKRPLYSRKLFERRKKKQQWMKIKVLNSVQNGTTGTLKYIKSEMSWLLLFGENDCLCVWLLLFVLLLTWLLCAMRVINPLKSSSIFIHFCSHS